jgi:hypothetical protein
MYGKIIGNNSKATVRRRAFNYNWKNYNNWKVGGYNFKNLPSF